MESRTPDGLPRELGVSGATALGLGSILGTGVFVSIGLAAGVAGPGVLVSIVLAAMLAACNALSSAQLAAAFPVSGGTYEYGHQLLSKQLGFTAGWMFLCAKTASAAAAALGAAGYGLHLLGLRPDTWLVPTAFTITVALTVLVLSGVRRSSRANMLIVSVTLTSLLVFAAAGIAHLRSGEGDVFAALSSSAWKGWQAILYASALMFVAYTGYARIATMGEEVRDPARNIPRAIIVTLAVSAAVYLLVAVAALAAVGPDALSRAVSTTATPLETAARALGVRGLGMLVAVGAVTAMLAVLLNLVLGLSRVALAMGRRGDVPVKVAAVDMKGRPTVAVAVTGLAIAGLTLVGELETAWAFSAFTVLIYYAITNLAALRLPKEQRLYPRWTALAGLFGCLALAAFLPRDIWLPGVGLLAAGIAWHAAARVVRTRS